MEKLLVFLLVSLISLGIGGGSTLIYEGTKDTLGFSSSSGKKEVQLVIGESEQKWQEALLAFPQSVRMDIPPLDFSTEVPLLISLGERPTGGYAVVVDKIVLEKGVLEVWISERSPRSDEFVTMAFTYPFDLVRLPKEKILGASCVVVRDRRGLVLAEEDLRW